jgi:hypothetical protein
MSTSRYSDAELKVIYAARYPDYRQLGGPTPSSHLIVLALAVQAGMAYAGHSIDGWQVAVNRTEATSVCRTCGAQGWATSRKVVPAMSNITKCPKP